MGYVDIAHKIAEHNIARLARDRGEADHLPDPHDYIAFTEDYPALRRELHEFEIVLAVDLIAELVRDGKLELTTPVERTVTYHDPCRLNKRKGVHAGPARDPARRCPGSTFVDVDHVTQWSYCSGAGADLRGREARDHGGDQPPAGREGEGARRVDTLVSARARGRSDRC